MKAGKALPVMPPWPLLEQAGRALEQRLAQSPDDPTILSRLAVVYRKQGDLSRAAAIYERLAAIQDAPEWRYLYALFSGCSVIPDVPSGRVPAPFVLLDNFLAAGEHDDLLPYVLSSKGAFEPALVGTGEYRPEVRQSLSLRGKRPVKAKFRTRVEGVLPEIWDRLLKAHIPEHFTEVKLRTYGDGDFFEIHHDRTDANRRAISFVYFFHRTPRAYQGGDLLLLDTDTEAEDFTEAAFTRIIPEDNRIVFFPSPYFHTVVPVHVPSRAFADGRFVLNGHVQVQ